MKRHCLIEHYILLMTASLEALWLSLLYKDTLSSALFCSFSRIVQRVLTLGKLPPHNKIAAHIGVKHLNKSINFYLFISKAELILSESFGTVSSRVTGTLESRL